MKFYAFFLLLLIAFSYGWTELLSVPCLSCKEKLKNCNNIISEVQINDKVNDIPSKELRLKLIMHLDHVENYFISRDFESSFKELDELVDIILEHESRFENLSATMHSIQTMYKCIIAECKKYQCRSYEECEKKINEFLEMNKKAKFKDKHVQEKLIDQIKKIITAFSQNETNVALRLMRQYLTLLDFHCEDIENTCPLAHEVYSIMECFADMCKQASCHNYNECRDAISELINLTEKIKLPDNNYKHNETIKKLEEEAKHALEDLDLGRDRESINHLNNYHTILEDASDFLPHCQLVALHNLLYWSTHCISNMCKSPVN